VQGSYLEVHKNATAATYKKYGIYRRLLNPCYLSRDDHNRKIAAGNKKKTDVGKYSFVKGIKYWNHLPAGVLASKTAWL
jgi:hypothetical protein